MFGSTILEVIIGMLFVYLLLSVLCSAIGEYLESKWNNRAKLLRQGIELLLNDSTNQSAAQAVVQAHSAVNALGLPIGWKGLTASHDDPRRAPGTFMDWVLKVVGVLLTGFAVSQGAPFWFDVLNKVIVVRSTVKPKEKSTEQPSKDRPPRAVRAESGD